MVPRKDGEAESDALIAQDVVKCLEAFKSIDKDLATAGPHIRMKIPSAGLRDELGRFRVWAGNIGAHRKGRASLDFKLREASHIRDRVIELLHNIIEVLGEVRAIVIGDKIPWEDLSDSDSDDSMSDMEVDKDLPTTELIQLLTNVTDINTCLMRLSMSIRNPAPHDQFKESTNIDFASYEIFDVDHVREKFPKAADYLAVRLGKAISRRRQYLRYREEHRNRYEQGLGLVENNIVAEGDKAICKSRAPATVVTNSRKAQSTVASSIPLAIKATKSISDVQALYDVEDGFSETSYASSSNDSTTLRPPPLPEQGQNSEPFECQLCFRITSVHHVGAWHKHVYRDLQPYVCTFESCDVPDRTYESRQRWTEHELQWHLGTWECVNDCNEIFGSSTDLREHLKSAHSEFVAVDRLDTLVETFRRQPSPNSGANCGLCLERFPTVAQLHRHMSKHQQELALFALPPRLGQGADPEESVIGVADMPSSRASLGSRSADACLLCPNCGFECRGSSHQQREVLRRHVNAEHVDLAAGSDAMTDAQLLERYPSIIPAMDSQIIDPTLLPGSLRHHIPDHVRTWQELKRWSSDSTDPTFKSDTYYESLQVAQYRLMLLTQEQDTAFPDAQKTAPSRDVEAEDAEDDEDYMSQTLTPHIETPFEGKLPAKADISRVVEANGGAEVLDALSHWIKLGYDLDLGRDLTNDEAMYIRQITIFGDPSTPNLDGSDVARNDVSLAIDGVARIPDSLRPNFSGPVGMLAPPRADAIRHRSESSPLSRNLDGGVLLEPAETQLPHAWPRMNLSHTNIGSQVPANPITSEESLPISTVDTLSAQHHASSLRTSAKHAASEDGVASIESNSRKSVGDLPHYGRCGCRIVEKTYIRADGHRSTFQDSILCQRARKRGRLCSNPVIRRTEYPDHTSVPVRAEPLTPTYQSRARRPSSASRPATRDGQINTLKPEIHIEIGINRGKPRVSITTGKDKGRSAGPTYDFDSSGLDASNNVRTGYPDIPLPSFGSGYKFRPSLQDQAAHVSPAGYNDLTSGYYDGSDADDTPSLATGTTASSSGTRSWINGDRRRIPSSFDSALQQPSSPYHTAEFTPRPRGPKMETSYTPEIVGRDEDRQRRREQGKREQEAIDREMAASQMREESRRVHFEFPRTRHQTVGEPQSSHVLKIPDRDEYRQHRREETERRLEALGREVAGNQVLEEDEKHISLESVRAKHQAETYALPRAHQQEETVLPKLRKTKTTRTRPDPDRSKSSRGNLDSAAEAPRARHHQPPPISYYNRLSPNLVPDNVIPVAQSAQQLQPVPPIDPWDVRNVSQALPSARRPGTGRHLPLQQQFTRRMKQAFYEGEHETDSEDDLQNVRRSGTD